MSKLQQVLYLATTRLCVMALTPELGASTHWINDDLFIDVILDYQRKGYAADNVASALVSAYRAVWEAGEN